MKKTIILFATVILTISLAGCIGNTSSDQSAQNSSVTSSSDVSSVEVKTEKLDESGIRDLMKENLNCMLNIFSVNSLTKTGPALKDNIYQVEMSEFKNYSEFEKYVKSVYTAETANMLLNDYPYEGDPKYINADGKLCINMDKAGNKAYFVDWSEYSVEITKSDTQICEFTLNTFIEEPSDDPQKEAYSVKASAKIENGKWLLTKMIY